MFVFYIYLALIGYLQDIENIASYFVMYTSVEMKITRSFERNINEGRKSTLTLGL